MFVPEAGARFIYLGVVASLCLTQLFAEVVTGDRETPPEIELVGTTVFGS